MNQTPNPLEIPEILSRVGLYIPLWDYSCQRRRPHFTPRHLLNCILVNRTWHDILLPILWFTLDDISIPTPVDLLHVLTRHSSHLRILELGHIPPSIFHTPFSCLPHNLLHLELIGLEHNEWSKSLILQNTRLQSLHWQGGDFHRDDYGTLDALALSRRLGRLQDLHLECWKLDRHFMKLLRRNPGLRRLALDFVTGEIIHRPPQTRTGDDGFKASSARKQHSERYPDHDRTSHGGQKEEEEKEGQEEKENKETEDEETEDEEISLPDLTSLTVCKDVESGALEALVRLCPNLQELSWMGSKDSDLRQLTTNVRECCPFLSVLTYSTVEISEDESVYVDLIQSVPRLVELQIRIPALGDRFTEALIKHAETLEILDLRILNHHALSNANLKRILMSCHQITALSIDGSQCGAEDLFSFDWACVRLNRLFLAGLHTMTRGQLKEADNGTVAAVYGWSIGPEARNAGIHLGSGTTNASVGEITGMNVIQTSDGLYFSPDLSTELQRSAHKVSTTFLRRLLSHLQRLVHLHSFVLNGVEYTRQSYSSGVICE